MHQPATKRPRPRSILGFTLMEVMLVAAIVNSIPVSQYAKAKQAAYQSRCVSNLREIGKMIVMYQMTEGTYPAAVFYPNDAFKDPKSIVRILEDAGYNLPREMWVCPGAPPELAQRGLTFVYNERLGGRANLNAPDKAWLLIEVNCVSRRVPKPHPGGYNVLCADGHVVTTQQLPADLARIQQAALPGLEGASTGRLARVLARSADRQTVSACAAR